MKKIEKEIYHYIQLNTHKIYKGLHVNYLNGQEDRTCTTGMINPKKQRQTYSYGNNGQGGGGGNKPITIKIREQNNLGYGFNAIRDNEGVKINY